MTFLFVLKNSSYFRNFDGVVRRLCQAGHRVKVLHGGQREELTDRALVRCAEECPDFEFEARLLGRTGIWRRVLDRSRGLSGYSRYLRPDHPTQWLGERYLRSLRRGVRPLIQTRLAKHLIASPWMQSLLSWIEQAAPPEPAILDYLRQSPPDTVVASPFVFSHLSPEVEYVKAALALRIPTVVAVASWDNLTSKGTFPLIPDLTLVWNQMLADEARVLHGVPREKISLCGALPFDFWFEMSPSLSREGYCQRAGIDASQPYIVYVCSSKSVGPAETSLVQEFAAELRRNGSARQANILVRPHPFNGKIWQGFREENVVVWPAGGDWPDVDDARRDYYHTLYFSSGVIGLNTSAFLEAAIIDRPCVTILSDRYSRMQSEIGHFQHLLRGGFLEVVHSLPEAAVVIEALLRGMDNKAEDRRRFVNRFVRPCGLDQPASEVAAGILANMASGESGATAAHRQLADAVGEEPDEPFASSGRRCETGAGRQ